MGCWVGWLIGREVGGLMGGTYEIWDMKMAWEGRMEGGRSSDDDDDTNDEGFFLHHSHMHSHIKHERDPVLLKCDSSC